MTKCSWKMGTPIWYERCTRAADRVIYLICGI